VIRESPQNTQGRTTPPQTAHRPDPAPPGTARHIVPTQHPLAPPATSSRCPSGGQVCGTGQVCPHRTCGAAQVSGGQVCALPALCRTPSRPSTPWYRPPHRPDPAPPGTARQGRCAVLGRCVLREGRCAVLGRCVLTAPAVRRRCREAHVGRCVLPGGRLSPARSPVGCVGRRSRPRGHGPRVLLGASPEGANGVLGGAPLAPSGQHSLRRPVPSPSGA
jgi:hypothetical protein